MGETDDDHITSLSESVTEVKDLDAETLAYASRTSNLQTRLLQTLDVLDETQHKHAIEMMDIEQKYARLRSRFEKQRDALAVSEQEKADLKDSVLQLVEKVEQSNDIRSWPFSRLRLTKVTGDPQQLRIDSRSYSEEDQLAYAGAIIDRLRRERDDERVAHVLIREDLQSKIDLLEAQLARREAELEFCATNAPCLPTFVSGRNDVNVGSNSSDVSLEARETRRGSLLTTPPLNESKDDAEDPQSGHPLRNTEVIKMLNMTAARNRALEVEIKTLFKRLQQARSIPSSSISTLPQLHLMDHYAVSQTQPNDPSVSTAEGDTMAHGVNEIEDMLDPQDEHYSVDDGHRATHNQQLRFRKPSSRNRGPSRALGHELEFTPFGQAPHATSRSNRHSHRSKHLKGSSAGVHKDDEQFALAQDQGLVAPNPMWQSTPVPASDSDDNSEPGIGFKLQMASPEAGPGVPISTSGIPSRQSRVNQTLGECGTTHGVIEMKDTSNLNFPAKGSQISSSRSATFAGLDEQIEALSLQIDAFRHEREKLSAFVTIRRQELQLPRRDESEPSAVSPTVSYTEHVHQPFTEFDTTEHERENETAGHGDHQAALSSTDDSEMDAVDILTRRLSVVEHDCLQLRHELNECRAVHQARENELLDEIRALQRQVAELSLLCHPPPTAAPTPFLSDEHDIVSLLDPDPGDGGRDQNLRQQPQHSGHQAETLSAFDTSPELVSDNTSKDYHHTTRPHHDQTSDGDNVGPEEKPSPVFEQTVDIPKHSLTSPPKSHASTLNLVPWSRPDDVELDGLLDVTDGEASMELATPLVPTTLLPRSSPPPEDASPSNSERGDRDDCESDHGSGSQSMILDDFDDIHRISTHEEYGQTIGLVGDGDGCLRTDSMDDARVVLERDRASDDSLLDDIDVGSGDDVFHNTSPPALLPREEAKEDQSDPDDGGDVNDLEEHLHQDRTCQEPLLLSHQSQHHDMDDPAYAKLEEDGEETVLVAPRSQPSGGWLPTIHNADDNDNRPDPRSPAPARPPLTGSLSPTRPPQL